jgi:hypothetical protein
LSGFGLGGADLPGGFSLGGGDLGCRLLAGLLERGGERCGFLPGGGGGGLGGAGVVAGGFQGFGERLGLGAGFGGAGRGGDGGGLGAATGGFSLGDLSPDPGRVQAGGLLAGSADQGGGLPDHAVQRGQRVSLGLFGQLRCGSGDAGVVMVAAGAVGAAELACPAAVLGGQRVAAAGPPARGGRAGLGTGGIAGHDGTFQC